MWVHMRKEWFPHLKKMKLHPGRDEPFRVAAKINDNAYRLELSSEHIISVTFNVTDLSYFTLIQSL